MRLTTLFCILGVTSAAAIAACGNSTSGGNGGAGTEGTGDQSTSTTANSTSTSGSTSSTTSSTGSTTSSTSTGSGSMLFNGCDETTAADHTADASVTINFPSGGLHYSPPCIKIAKGNSVTFAGDFASHPLRAGDVSSGTPVPDTTSPIMSTDTGTMASFTFPNAGKFGYYCNFHEPGMAGAIFVQ